MNKHKNSFRRKMILIAIIDVILAIIISWMVTALIVKLITMCFGWYFSFPMATGI